ncbi:universal stress protein [Smaragdicoccus niigatensis]|uniref:universal stress protein n=1 Tax=Smaragdicoccus niigatensis TaxID=359359 RepID=UPI00037C113E|nr:universal stress protein [Smaragdicoccus niigatensis]
MPSHPDPRSPALHGNEIVIGVDDSRTSESTVRCAARTASKRGRTLRIAHGLDLAALGAAVDYPDLAVHDLVARLRRRAEDAVERARRTAHAVDPNLTVVTEISPESAARVLTRRSESAYEVVVGAGSGADSIVGRIGSTITAVASHAHAPVVVVRGDLDRSPRPADAPVVLGLDGHPAGDAAIGLAFDEASWRGTGLVVVHAWSDLSLGVFAQRHQLLTPPQAFEEAESVVVAERLAGWQEKYPDVTVSRRVYLDGPRQHLLRWSQRAQLVVVGSRGRGGLAGMLLGSTSAALIAQSRCPVMVVRPDSVSNPYAGEQK